MLQEIPRNHLVERGQVTILHNFCAVHWGKGAVHWRKFSTPGDIMKTVGDIMSILGSIEYTGEEFIMINVGKGPREND